MMLKDNKTESALNVCEQSISGSLELLMIITLSSQARSPLPEKSGRIKYCLASAVFCKSFIVPINLCFQLTASIL